MLQSEKTKTFNSLLLALYILNTKLILGRNCGATNFLRALARKERLDTTGLKVIYGTGRSWLTDTSHWSENEKLTNGYNLCHLGDSSHKVNLRTM